MTDGAWQGRLLGADSHAHVRVHAVRLAPSQPLVVLTVKSQFEKGFVSPEDETAGVTHQAVEWEWMSAEEAACTGGGWWPVVR